MSTKLTENIREVRNGEVEERWNKIRKTIEESAEEVIGEKSEQRTEEWCDEECAEAIKARNEYRLAVLQRSTRQTSTSYNESRRRAKNIIKKKKREF